MVNTPNFKFPYSTTCHLLEGWSEDKGSVGSGKGLVVYLSKRTSDRSRLYVYISYVYYMTKRMTLPLYVIWDKTRNDILFCWIGTSNTTCRRYGEVYMRGGVKYDGRRPRSPPRIRLSYPVVCPAKSPSLPPSSHFSPLPNRPGEGHSNTTRPTQGSDPTQGKVRWKVRQEPVSHPLLDTRLGIQRRQREYQGDEAGVETLYREHLFGWVNLTVRKDNPDNVSCNV